MLDKSVPYHNLIMRMDAAAAAALPMPAMPAGFSLRPFAPGDERHWARLETAVGEFDSVEEALSYFKERFADEWAALSRRCFFACTPDGTPTATATAWYEYTGKTRCASLYWVSAHPGYQGKGLGRAVTVHALRALAALEPGLPVYLHTQTWSHPAVSLYASLGFVLLKTETFSRYANEYVQALPVLKKAMKPAAFARLTEGAE